VTANTTINSKTDVNTSVYPLHVSIILDHHQVAYFILIFVLLFVIVLKVTKYFGYIVHNRMQKNKDSNLNLLSASLILFIIP
jgi:hypothetical protein